MVAMVAQMGIGKNTTALARTQLPKEASDVVFRSGEGSEGAQNIQTTGKRALSDKRVLSALTKEEHALLKTIVAEILQL